MGYYFTGTTGERTLIEHWNGTAWRQVASPNPGGSPFLTGVAATSARNAWAVGSYNNLHGADSTLIEHWNGTAWRRVRSPNPGGANVLSGVAATSATDVWAVGWYGPASSPRGVRGVWPQRPGGRLHKEFRQHQGQATGAALERNRLEVTVQRSFGRGRSSAPAGGATSAGSG